MPASRKFIFCWMFVFFYPLQLHADSSITLLTHQKPGGIFHPIIREKAEFGLVLSGGGSRGISHLGSLKVFAEMGQPIDFIAGTSMGAIVGAFYAAGYSPRQIESILYSISWFDIFEDKPDRKFQHLWLKQNPDRHLFYFQIKPFSLEIPPAIMKGHRIHNELNKYLIRADYYADFDFNQLPIRYRAAAIDLNTGDLHVFQDGLLATALRASMAIPGVFTPVIMDSLILVDGGTFQNLPVSIAKNEGIDYICAIDVMARRKKLNLTNLQNIFRQILRLNQTKQRQEALTDVDFLLTPEIEEQNANNFSNFDWLIRQGQQCAEKQFDSLQNDWQKILHPLPDSILKINVSGNQIQSTDFYLDSIHAYTVSNQGKLTQEGLLTHLWNTGFVSAATLTTMNEKDSLQLNIQIQENEIIKAITFSKSKHFTSDELHGCVYLKENTGLNYQWLKQSVSNIDSLYLRKGLTLAGVKKIEFEKGDLIFLLDEPLIKAIELNGNHATGAQFIMNEIHTKIGDDFKIENIQTDIERLYATGIFESVTFNIAKEENGLRLIYAFVEKNPAMLQIGSHYDLEEGAALKARIHFPNLWGNGHKLNCDAVTGRGNFFQVQYASLRMNSLPVSYDAHISFEQKTRYYFDGDNRRHRWKDEESFSTAATVHYQFLQRFGEFSIGHRFYHVKFLPDFENLNQSAQTLELGYYFDTLDHPDFPRSGGRLKVQLETPIRQHANKNLRLDMQSRKLIPLNLRTVLDLNAQVGLSSGDLAYHRKFFMGGLPTFIGSFTDNFSLTNFARIRIEGRILLKTYLNDIRKKAYLRVITDGLWSESPILQASGQKIIYGWGLGVSFDTLIGPVHLLWGTMDNKYNKVYCSLGYEF